MSSARGGERGSGGGNDGYADRNRDLGERVQPGQVIEHTCEQPGQIGGNRDKSMASVFC
jgi:hypothetical protein